MKGFSAVAALAVALALDFPEPNYDEYCCSPEEPCDDDYWHCSVNPVPASDMDAKFRRGEDNREILTYVQTVEHTCRYPGPDTFGCEDIPDNATIEMPWLSPIKLCGTCARRLSYWCSEDGTEVLRQLYDDDDCQVPIGDCDECKHQQGYGPIVIDTSAHDKPLCEKKGLCSAEMPPATCETHYRRGCAATPCDPGLAPPETCSGCCIHHGGAESLTTTLTWNVVREARFHCLDGACSHTPSGGVHSLGACQRACTQGPTWDTFQCVNGQCVAAPSGVGKDICDSLCDGETAV